MNKITYTYIGIHGFVRDVEKFGVRIEIKRLRRLALDHKILAINLSEIREDIKALENLIVCYTQV